jgi:hypothetical protein
LSISLKPDLGIEIDALREPPPMQHAHTLPMPPAIGVAREASFVAIAAGVAAWVLHLPVAVADTSAQAAWFVSMGGLVTALGSQVFPYFKLWLEDRKAERAAKEARHGLAGKLQELTLRESLLAAEVLDLTRREELSEQRNVELRRIIEQMATRPGVPLVALPADFAEPKNP